MSGIEKQLTKPQIDWIKKQKQKEDFKSRFYGIFTKSEKFGVPNCPNCNGIGFIKYAKPHSGYTACECCRKIYNIK